jgi:hypothetical protein
VRWAATSKAFWQTLADAVGVPVSALFAVPSGDGASSAGELSASIPSSAPCSYNLDSIKQLLRVSETAEANTKWKDDGQ